MDAKVSIHLDHDIYRYAFKNKGRAAQNVPGSILLEKEDFGKLFLSPQWWYAFDCHGQGHAIHFPIRAKCILRRSPRKYGRVKGTLTLLPQKPVEIISFYIARCQRSIENIA